MNPTAQARVAQSSFLAQGLGFRVLGFGVLGLLGFRVLGFRV